VSFLKSLAFAGPLLVAGSGAFAADLAVNPPTVPPVAGWVVTLGLGPQVLPDFPGSKSYTVLPTGHFEYRRPGDPPTFYAPDDGVDIALLDLGWFKAGPVARFVERRGLSDGNGNFFGLHNVDWSIEGGGFVEFWPWRDHLRTRLELRQGITGHHGLVGNVEIDAVQRYGAFTFSLGPRLALGNDRYMQNYFSVTPQEAALNGRVTPYQAYGGVTSMGALGSIKYDFTPNWSATGFGGYDRFVNSAAESPITNNLGSKNQFTGGVIVAYSFNFGGLGIFGF
jgi:outer membrane protein